MPNFCIRERDRGRSERGRDRERERFGFKTQTVKGAFLYREETTKLQFFSLWRIWKHQCVSVRVSEREREREGRGLCSVQEVTGNRNKKTNSIFERKPFVKEKVN